jgi:tetratricopeptide (TPR) repeat protein
MVQPDVRLQLYRSHCNMGWILRQQAKYKQATESYRKALLCCRQLVVDQQLRAADVHHSLGIVLAEQGQWQIAIYHYHQAIALNPQLVLAFYNLGIALLQQDDSRAALEIYRHALSLEPIADQLIRSSLYAGLGQALQLEGQVEAAIAAHHQAIVLDPENAKVQYRLALMHQQRGAHHQAIALFQTALQLDSNLTSIEGDCGFSWLALDEFAAAMGCFQRAIAPNAALVAAYCKDALSLSTATAADEMLLAKIAFGRFLAALQFYPAALQVEPEHQSTLCRTYLAQSLVCIGAIF